MMNKISALAFVFCATTLSAQVQKPLNKVKPVVEWEESPKVHAVPREYATEPAVYLRYDVSLDYRFEGRDLNMYYTRHELVKVLDEKGIEWYNKIEIPVNRGTRVPLIKARTILPNGKVYEIAKEMIKVTRDEYGRNMVVIAMEGVEKNAEIELLLKEIKSSSLFGSEPFQFSVPIAEAHFDMAYPKDMIFEEKGYNGFPDAKDTLLGNRRHINLVQTNVPALRAEPHSFLALYRQRAEYRVANFIDENTNENKKLFSWDDLAKKMHEEYYNISNKERIAVGKYLTELGVRPNGNEMENIRKIENGIKSNIVLYSYVDGDNSELLDSIITKKQATSDGYIKLFAACLTEAGVNHELGLTTDRKEHKFDNKFANWGNMENHVFYFPKLKKFMSPTSIYYRCPIIPDELINNKGVFSLIPPVGETIGNRSEVITINSLPVNESQQNMSAEVSFTKDMEANIQSAYSFSGYTATDLREALIVQSDDKKKQTIRNLIPFAEKEENIVKYNTDNEALDNYYSNKPLELFATVNAPQLTEKAGAKYLFRIGDLIGKQEQLYEKKERKLPVDLDYPHSLNRTITLNIPDGYKISNPEALRIHADYVDQNVNPVISFKSDYTINGNKLIVTITESYSQTHFSKNEYENYRKVINAAADFNKVALLLEKKRG